MVIVRVETRLFFCGAAVVQGYVRNKKTQLFKCKGLDVHLWTWAEGSIFLVATGGQKPYDAVNFTPAEIEVCVDGAFFL